MLIAEGFRSGADGDGVAGDLVKHSQNLLVPFNTAGWTREDHQATWQACKQQTSTHQLSSAVLAESSNIANLPLDGNFKPYESFLAALPTAGLRGVTALLTAAKLMPLSGFAASEQDVKTR